MIFKRKIPNKHKGNSVYIKDIKPKENNPIPINNIQKTPVFKKLKNQ